MAKGQKSKSVIYIIIAVIVITILAGYRLFQPIMVSPFPEKVYVKRVVDGDTFVDAQKRRYRLIGIDTPELKRGKKPEEPLAKEAYRFTEDQIEGKTVRIEYDKDKLDRYNRYLVYVYTPDGQMLNEILLLRGFADVYRKQSFAYKEKFLNLEGQAQSRNQGIWKSK